MSRGKGGVQPDRQWPRRLAMTSSLRARWKIEIGKEKENNKKEGRGEKERDARPLRDATSVACAVVAAVAFASYVPSFSRNVSCIPTMGGGEVSIASRNNDATGASM